MALKMPGSPVQSRPSPLGRLVLRRPFHFFPPHTAMKRILRENARKYAFDWRDEPLLRVEPGESFELETDDASTGYFRSPDDKALPAKRPGFDRSPPLANPIAGPIYVEGARRGDTLVVHLEDILVGDYSWI